MEEGGRESEGGKKGRKSEGRREGAGGREIGGGEEGGDEGDEERGEEGGKEGGEKGRRGHISFINNKFIFVFQLLHQGEESWGRYKCTRGGGREGRGGRRGERSHAQVPECEAREAER